MAARRWLSGSGPEGRVELDASQRKIPPVIHHAPPDVLYLAHRVPYPPDKGDRIRNYHLLRYLSRRAAVHLACLADEPVPAEATAALRALSARLAIVPLGNWTRRLRALGFLLRGRTLSEGAFHSPALVDVLRRALLAALQLLFIDDWPSRGLLSASIGPLRRRAGGHPLRSRNWPGP